MSNRKKRKACGLIIPPWISEEKAQQVRDAYNKEHKNKFINRNKALERSNNAHARLMIICTDRKDNISADYHHEVLRKQNKYKIILSKKTRRKIFDKHYNRAWNGGML